jgi:hypothetical protein
MTNPTHLLTETPLPRSQYNAEVLRKQFKAAYGDIVAKYPQYGSFRYVCIEVDDDSINVLLYGIGE